MSYSGERNSSRLRKETARAGLAASLRFSNY
jgi:hypothetical protein